MQPHPSLEVSPFCKFDNMYKLLTAHKPSQICAYCCIKQTARTRHCLFCDVCIERFDHHCPWIDNCVGQGNFVMFYVYLVI